MVDTFPRQYARTQRFTLGEPRDLTVSPDGHRVVFLRSRGGDDPVNCLWVVDAATGAEQMVADPVSLLSGTAHDPRLLDDLPAAERARRERLREGASGITSYATDAAVTVASFSLGGHLYVAGLMSGRARPLGAAGPVFDPRPDPPARRVAYVSGSMLCLAELDGSWKVLAGGDLDEPDTVSWGSAEFIAAEEMRRMRGFWWSPDGDHLAVCRVDTAPVQRWYIANAADPASAPARIAYPAAGTPNAEVTLHLFPIDGSEPVDVEWDRAALPYLADVSWTTAGLIITVQTRDQRHLEVRSVDPVTGATQAVFRDEDDAWVELVPGSPRLLADGRLVVCADRDGARRLLVDGEITTGPELQVRSILGTEGHEVYFSANPCSDATVVQVWRRDAHGKLSCLSQIEGEGEGVHTAAVGGSSVVLRSVTLDRPGPVWRLPGGQTLDSWAEVPLLAPTPQIFHTTGRQLATAVLLPTGHDGSPLPVLMDPYGGPHAQRVVRSQGAFLASQWFAEQGFAVVIVDGRGTPGRGSVFEREVHRDLATLVLADQVDALHQAAEITGVLDLDRVAIRGWSFGGYLAALAVMQRPDVFHAAIAGAPVTEWRLYDTHYTERYLGDPNQDPAAYETSSLLPLADRLTRPLLLIHGLADDNVVAAHTLQLSTALLAAGRTHEVLPLAGVTHMTPQEVIAENLLLHQLDFLRRSLGLTTVPDHER